nr:MAG TPA: hypothetical protein [Caudoviricetes sp.]
MCFSYHGLTKTVFLLFREAIKLHSSIFKFVASR